MASGMMVSRTNPTEKEFFIDNLLVRIHFIIVMIKWTGLAPWEFTPARMLSRTNPAVVGRSGRLHVCGLRPARPGRARLGMTNSVHGLVPARTLHSMMMMLNLHSMLSRTNPAQGMMLAR